MSPDCGEGNARCRAAHVDSGSSAGPNLGWSERALLRRAHGVPLDTRRTRDRVVAIRRINHFPRIVKLTINTFNMRSPPPSSKSRSTNGHDKPKRPLSGYNLFYRYKRHAIVTQVQSTGSCEKLGREEVLRILSTPSGLETQAIAGAPSSDHLRSLREVNIRSMMDDKLFPNENRNRSHRKVHGIGFLELNRLLRQEWAKLDNFTRKIFQDLAEIGCAR